MLILRQLGKGIIIYTYISNHGHCLFLATPLLITFSGLVVGNLTNSTLISFSEIHFNLSLLTRPTLKLIINE